MRDSNSTSFQLSSRPSKLGRYCLVAITTVIGLAGCSKLADQPISFPPIAQAQTPSLSDQQNQHVKEILDRQNEMRLATLEAEAAAEAQEAHAREVLAATRIALEEAQVDAATNTVNEEALAVAQQEEIVNHAALRASDSDDESSFVGTETEFGVALVGFETEVDPFSEGLLAAANGTNTSEETNEGVRLNANIDDLEDVPQNIAREDSLFAADNLLRSRSIEYAQQAPENVELQAALVDAPPVAAPVAQVDTKTLASQRIPGPIQFPLQPMLFNADTRELNRSVEGTLRPKVSTVQKIEPEVAIARTSETFAASPGPLSPLQETVKLKSERFTASGHSDTFSSRLLRPIERTARSGPEVAPNDFRTIKPQKAAQLAAPSQQIDVAAHHDEPVTIGPQENGPIVDATLANAKPAYLQSQPTATPQTFVPPEVFQDAENLANDVAQELVANAIAVGPIEANNDFKVRTTSGTGSEHEPGHPLVGNNDFAIPESPSGDFVAPMTVTASEVPAVVPGEFERTSSEFGTPLNLETPKLDSLVAHIAALPTLDGSNASAKSNVPPVGITTLMELDSVTWKSRLDEAIDLAQQRLDQIKQPSDVSVVNLRLLKALRAQMVQMENSSGELSPSEARYWQHQLEAITSMLGTPSGKNQALTDYHRHQSAHKTLAHLRNAVSQLESIANLQVNSGQFCTEITGFGKFRTFDSNRFKAGQKMLVYCEVENYRTVEHQSAIATEFRTRLRGSFAIYDANGKVVQQAEYPTVDDVARKRRRDFYMYMPVTLGKLPAGEYVLHALVEDVHGNKTASLDPPLPFIVE